MLGLKLGLEVRSGLGLVLGLVSCYGRGNIGG